MEVGIANFVVPLNNAIIHGDIITKEGISPKLVILHGAGNGTREKYCQLRHALANVDIGSMAFDFIGFGETGGDLSETSLQSRTEQAIRVIEELRIEPPFSILGASMGGYTAIKLLDSFNISSLILFVPAVYDKKAYDIPFGIDFTTAIRKPNSWMATDAWDILSRYTGNALLVQAENDVVIPEEIIHRIYNAAIKAKKRSKYLVKESPHLLIHYLSQHETELQAIIKLIQESIEN